MSYQKHNFTPGAVLLASQLNDMDNQIEILSESESDMSDAFKTALLECFENVAWINDQGQTYYNNLYNALYPYNTFSVTNVLNGCTTSNNSTNVRENSQYVAIITPNEGYSLDGATVNISMGGNNVTNLYYSNGSINIPNVTGNLIITVTAITAVSSISAVFTQGSTVIYDTDSLNTLRQYLVVTATFSDSTTATVTDYTLSGTLTEGTSTITVSYGGKTTTFTVVVTHYVDSRTLVYYWDFTGVNPLVDKVAEKTATESGTVNYSATNGLSFGTNTSNIDLGIQGSAIAGCDIELTMGDMVSTGWVNVHQRLFTSGNNWGFILRKDNQHWQIYGSNSTWYDTGLARDNIANKLVKISVYSASDVDVYVDGNLMLENATCPLSTNELRIGATSSSSIITNLKSLKIYRRE